MAFGEFYFSNIVFTQQFLEFGTHNNFLGQGIKQTSALSNWFMFPFLKCKAQVKQQSKNTHDGVVSWWGGGGFPANHLNFQAIYKRTSKQIIYMNLYHSLEQFLFCLFNIRILNN